MTVDICHIIKFVTPKFLQKPCFTYLTGSFQNQRLSIRSILPFYQRTIQRSFHTFFLV